MQEKNKCKSLQCLDTQWLHLCQQYPHCYSKTNIRDSFLFVSLLATTKFSFFILWLLLGWVPIYNLYSFLFPYFTHNFFNLLLEWNIFCKKNKIKIACYTYFHDSMYVGILVVILSRFFFYFYLVFNTNNMLLFRICHSTDIFLGLIETLKTH